MGTLLKVNSLMAFLLFVPIFYFLSERILAHVLTWSVFCLSLLECELNKKCVYYVHVCIPTSKARSDG